jgi:hypothetical protein
LKRDRGAGLKTKGLAKTTEHNLETPPSPGMLDEKVRKLMKKRVVAAFLAKQKRKMF